MRWPGIKYSPIGILCLTSLLANADVLYQQDFEGGDAPGWRTSGRGTIGLTQYAGNTSLRLSKHKAATLHLSTAGYEDVEISMQMAAGGLGRRDTCIAELSLDAGEHWQAIVEVRDGQDDELTLYHGKLAPDGVDDNPGLHLRFRASGRNEDSFCWGDNVMISGMAAGATTQTDNIFELDFLYGQAAMTRPVDYSAFTADGAPGSAARQLLVTILPQAVTGMAIHLDLFNSEKSGGDGLRIFPGVSIELLQIDGNLVPIDQGIRQTRSANWELGFQVGRVWRVRSHDVSRYSLPFALYEKNANCTHNGVLTWAIKDSGESSRAAFQIVSETCPYFKFDMWGALDIELSNTQLEAAQATASAYHANRRARLPVKPIDQLKRQFPNIDMSGFGAVANMNPDNMSVYGFVVDGVHYRGGCDTQFGPYPYCDELLLPSYSTAKSIFAGLAMMRLEKILPGAAALKIGELVPECDGEQWRDVTIENVLDMASGNFDSAVYGEDEASPEHIAFLYAQSHAERIEFACAHYKRKVAPGSKWLYRTSDTYIAGSAMRRALAEYYGRDVDVFDELVVRPIFEPLNLSSTIRHTRQSYDDIRQPLFGWGLTMLADDAIRIADWLNGGSAAIGDDAVLDDRLFSGAMQLADGDLGLPALLEGTRYNNGFWSLDISPFIDCEHPVRVPFMSGYGGISIVMFPNDTIYYYYSDGYVFRWREAAVASNKIRSMCT